MSNTDNLVRISDVLDILNNLGVNVSDYDMYNRLFDEIGNMTPVNAVELPCKVGDKIFEVYRCKIYEQTVKGFTTSDRVELINCETKNFYRFELGKKVFFTREEAEKALEDLKNG